MSKFIQARLIIGGRKYFPDLASEIIAQYTGGFSHIETFVPSGLDWAPEGWLYSARSDKLSARKCQSLILLDKNFLAGKVNIRKYGIPRGVQFRPPGYCSYRRCVILTIPVTDQQHRDFWISQKEKYGKPYDWRSIIAFAAPFGLTRNWHKTNSWMCSEGFEDSMENAGILSEFWLAPYKVSPGLTAARTEVLPLVWATEIKPGTDPKYESLIAMRDWVYHKDKDSPQNLSKI